jgi:hypothetical protein
VALVPGNTSLFGSRRRPDAVEPAGKVCDHWFVWNVDEHGYGGPNPPDREHTYRFRLYAVEGTIDRGPDATKEDLEDGRAPAEPSWSTGREARRRGRAPAGAIVTVVRHYAMAIGNRAQRAGPAHESCERVSTGMPWLHAADTVVTPNGSSDGKL